MQALAVGLGRAGVALDHRGEDGLGVGGLVLLVVAVAAEADEINEDVAAELMAEVGGESRGPDDGLGLVAVDVEDGSVDKLGDVGAIGRTAGVFGIGREADEVVEHHVDGAAHGVALEEAHVEALGDDALALDGGIAVDEEADDAAAVGIAHQVLLCAAAAHNGAVDALQVAGVVEHREVDRAGTILEHLVGRIAAVVLHVAAAAGTAFMPGVLELGEDAVEVFAHEVTEDAEAAAVRHAEDDFLHAQFARALRDGLHRGDEALAALEAEPLFAWVALAEELVEDFGRGEVLEEPELLAGVHGGGVRCTLDARTEPLTLCAIWDVHELEAHRAAVAGFEAFDERADGRRAPGKAEGRAVDRLVEVAGFQAVIGGFEDVGAWPLPPEWVDLRGEVAHVAVRADEVLDRPLEWGFARDDARAGGAGHGKVKAREELAHVLGHAVGVREVLLIEGIEVFRVPAVDGSGSRAEGRRDWLAA